MDRILKEVQDEFTGVPPGARKEEVVFYFCVIPSGCRRYKVSPMNMTNSLFFGRLAE